MNVQLLKPLEEMLLLLMIMFRN
ncbi:UNVERIFIED_CONTAM: hypothetical protein GTU68_041051 [Idotea baltica]|nr:hypothetical protein [Idotea baltica]